jgi:hypothetical protein
MATIVSRRRAIGRLALYGAAMALAMVFLKSTFSAKATT